MDVILKIIATVAIPFIITLLKKWKLPTKWCPIVAVVLAVIYVVIAKFAGIEADLNTMYQMILAALGIAGASVLGYDTVKKLTEKDTK